MANPISKAIDGVAEGVEKVTSKFNKNWSQETITAAQVKINKIQEMMNSGKLSPDGMDKAAAELARLKSQLEPGPAPVSPPYNPAKMPSSTSRSQAQPFSPQVQQDLNASYTQQPQNRPQITPHHVGTQEQLETMQNVAATNNPQIDALDESIKALEQRVFEEKLRPFDPQSSTNILKYTTALENLRGQRNVLEQNVKNAAHDYRFGLSERKAKQEAEEAEAQQMAKQQQKENNILTGRAKAEVKMRTAHATQQHGTPEEEEYIKAFMDSANKLKIDSDRQSAIKHIEAYKTLEAHDKAAVRSLMPAFNREDDLGNKMIEVARMKYINDANGKGVSEEEAINKFNELHNIAWEMASAAPSLEASNRLLKAGMPKLKQTSNEKYTESNLRYTSPVKVKLYGKEVDSSYHSINDGDLADTPKLAKLRQKLADSIDNPEKFEIESKAPRVKSYVHIKSEDDFRYLKKVKQEDIDKLKYADYNSKSVDSLDAYNRQVDEFIWEYMRNKDVTRQPSALRGFKDELYAAIARQDTISEEGKANAIAKAKIAEQRIQDYIVGIANQDKKTKHAYDIRQEAKAEAKEELSNTDIYPFMINLKPEAKNRHIENLAAIIYNKKMAERYKNYKNSQYGRLTGMRGPEADQVNAQFKDEIQKTIDRYTKAAAEADKKFTLRAKVSSRGNINKKDNITRKVTRVSSTTENKAEELTNNLIEAEAAYMKAKNNNDPNLAHYEAEYKYARQAVENKRVESGDIDKILRIGKATDDKPVTFAEEENKQKVRVQNAPNLTSQAEKLLKAGSGKTNSPLMEPDEASKHQSELFKQALKLQKGEDVAPKASKAETELADLKAKYEGMYNQLKDIGVDDESILEILKKKELKNK